MSEFLTNANGFIALLTGLIGLIGTAIGAFAAIKCWIKAMKEKKSAEIWAMITTIADAAMKEAERSTANGVAKKQMVIESVKAGCQAAGLDIDDFIDQLSAYIDVTISFVNEMKNKGVE